MGPPPPLNLPLLTQNCLICYNTYSIEEFSTLTCGHIFCKHCLNARTDGNMLICPTCKIHIDLGDLGVEGPSDSYLFSDFLLNVINSPDDVRSTAPAAFQNQWTTVVATTTAPSTHYLSPVSQTTCQSCNENMPVSKVGKPVNQS